LALLQRPPVSQNSLIPVDALKLSIGLSTARVRADNRPMIRPCYLVVDRETSSAISTRKLIIETAKFNVITAYSSSEAIATLEKFPNIDGVVADAGIEDMPCQQLVEGLKQLNPKITVIVICTPRYATCTGADYSL
jgi:response regulator RpfG family c-di-GMP phosphodiesterase